MDSCAAKYVLYTIRGDCAACCTIKALQSTLTCYLCLHVLLLIIMPWLIDYSYPCCRHYWCDMQVLLGLIARPPKTSMVRRVWNLTHWTVGRAVLALAIANIFIGTYLSHVANKHIIAQAVVLGGLFIIYMLKNDIEYLLVRISPAEEDRLLASAQQPGMVCIHTHSPQDSLLDLHAFGCCPAVLHTPE